MLITLRHIQKQLERLDLNIKAHNLNEAMHICTDIVEDIEDVAEVLDNAWIDDLEGMMPCDFTGYCSIRCPRYGINCDGI